MRRNTNTLIGDRCPISFAPVKELNDPVVLNRRVYSREALLSWYLNQYRQGYSLKDLFTQKVLPPVKCERSSFEVFLSYAPNITRKQRKGFMYAGILISLLSSKILNAAHPEYISESTFINLYYVKSTVLIACFSLLIMTQLRDVKKILSPRDIKKDEEAIEKWLDEQTENYNPVPHTHKNENSEALSNK